MLGNFLTTNQKITPLKVTMIEETFHIMFCQTMKVLPSSMQINFNEFVVINAIL